MISKFLRMALFGAIALSPLWGQSDVARIVGTVADSSGAVIPNAAVTVKNELTGQSRKLAANGQGYFVATQLLPAVYSVTVEAPGMAPAEYKGVQLQVGQERTLNITLQPATVSTEVNVSGGDLAVVDTSSARIGANVVPARSGQAAHERPPGFAALPAGARRRQQRQRHLRQYPLQRPLQPGERHPVRRRGRQSSSSTRRPGNLNGETTSQFRLEQSLENVQEFRVDSSNYPAEYGTGTGGQISFITKSGSNDVARLGLRVHPQRRASTRAISSTSATKSKLRLNQFGGSVGRPDHQGQGVLLRQL